MEAPSRNDAGAETVTFAAPISDVWDRFEFQYCSIADPSDCTQRKAHVVILGGTNQCAPEAIAESFRNSTVQNEWLLGSTARLTAAMTSGGDAEGDGWLRLPNLAQFSYSDALLNIPFASAQGVSMSFESAQWGAVPGDNPGDGITFFLVDGDKISLKNPNAPTTNLPPANPGDPQADWEYNSAIDTDPDNQMFRAGAPGGSLGYAQRLTHQHYMPGMKHAVIGVGFDASGWYARDNEGKVGGISDHVHPNAISLRGNAENGWPFIASTGTIAETKLGCTSAGNGIPSCDTERPTEIGEGRYKSIVNIEPIDATKYRVTVFTQNEAAGGFIERINVEVHEPLPENLKLGFTGSSGGSARNFNEVRNIAVEVFADLGIDLVVDELTPSGTFPTGEDVTLTYTIENHLAATVCAAHVDIQLPEGFEITDQSCDASSGGTGATCGDLNNLGVGEDYIALGPNGEVVVTITGRFTHTDDDDVLVSGRVTPGAGQGDKDPLDNYVSVSGKIASAPVLNDQTLDALPGQPRTIDILDGATPGDAPIDPTTAIITDVPAGVTADIVNGELTVTLPANAKDPVTITVQVRDEDGVISAPATITVVPSLPPQVGDVEVWFPDDAGHVDVLIESDDPSDVFTIDVAQTPTNADATVQGKTVTVAPDTPDTPGTHTAVVEACNTVPAPATACTEIDVTVVYNDLPTITGGTTTLPAGGTAELDIVADPGVVGTISTTTLINPPAPALGTCAIVNDKVVFTAAAGAGGDTAVCTVEVCEEKPENHCSSETFTFGILNVFTPTDDTIATAQGDLVSVATADLLANDGNADPATFTLNAGSAVGGAVAIVGTDVVFTPTADATSGSFTYNVCAAYDASLCEDVTVTVDITAKPGATPGTAWTLPETPVTVDTPFDVPTDTTVDGIVTGGDVSVGTNGEITVTPDPGFVGEIEIPVKGCTLAMPIACETTIITVTVNDLPTMDDDSRVVAPGQSQSITPTTDAGTVGAINTSSLSIDHGASTEANGTCSIEAGSVKYVANADASVGQTDVCVAEICEVQPAGACVTAEFSFQIDASFNPSDDNISTLENVDKEISIGTLLNNDGGADEDSFEVVGTPDGDGVYTTSEGGSLVPSGTGGYIYTPAEDFVGDDTFTYNVCSSSDATDCEDVTVTVFVNDRPTLEGASRLVAPEQTVTITPNVDEGQVGEIDWSSIEILPESTQSQGTCTIGDGPDYDITYTANAGADADETDICVVQVCEVTPDDACVTASFEFTISAAFDPQPDELVTTQEVPVEFTKDELLENDGGTVEDTFTLVGTPDEDGVITTVNGGTLVPDADGETYIYTPAENFTGEDTFSYEVCSAFDEDVCEEVVVTVIVKQTPDAVDSTVWVVTGTPDVEVDLGDNYTGDSPIDSVTVTNIGPKDEHDNAPGTVTVDEGVITFIPNDPDAAVVYEIDVEICDADDICTDVTVTVVYNDPPVAGPPTANIPEGRDGDFTIPFNRIVSGSNQGDVEGGWDEGSIVVSDDPNGPFTEGPVDLDGTHCAIVDGQLIYTVEEEALTLGTCYVQVCELEPGPAGTDATDRACTVIELTPEFVEMEDVVITGPANNTETTDKTPTVTGTSEPNTEVTITVDGEPVATVPVDENGNWTWTPDEDLEEGPHTITVTGESGVPDEITIVITEEEDPVIPGDDDVSITGPADNSSTDDKTPTVTGTGEPGTEVTITVDGEPAGTVTVGEDGKWSWTPDEDLEEGPHTIVAKGENGSEDQITLTITEPDEKPVDGEPDADVALTGGRFLSCASTGTGAPAPATGLLALFVGLGLVLRRRKTARS